MPEKIIRDPVHDIIAFRTESPLDLLLLGLVNAEEFQRLRRIRQLGMASLAYPGAEHSRYSHSLGVMETARKILAQLALSHQIDSDRTAVCVVAALLHDLGHGPFSHVFERVSSVEHEKATRKIVLDPDSDVHARLSDYDLQLPQRVAEFMSGRTRSFFFDIFSSQLDADRLDYLLRDNLMTGAGYGGYDLRWLLHALTVEPKGNRLAVASKGVSAVEGYLQARFHMYRNVYFHKVVRSAEGMVGLALQRAKRLAVQGRLGWPPQENAVHKALLGRDLSTREYRDLDDVTMMQAFKSWADSEDVVLARLCRGLLFREVYKTVDLAHLGGSEEARAALERARQAVDAAGGDPDYDVFYDEPADIPYETYHPEHDGSDEIMVLEDDGRQTPFTAASPLTRVLERQLTFRRLHVAPAWEEVVAREVKA